MSSSKTQKAPAKKNLFTFPTAKEIAADVMNGAVARLQKQQKGRNRKQANLPLMQTTKVEKRRKDLLNCKMLKAYEARVSGRKFIMFGEEEASSSFEDLKKIVGYLNASAKKFNDLFLKYKEPLTLKYEQLIFKDDYGDLDERYILEEYKNFLSRKTDVLFLVERCDFFLQKQRERKESSHPAYQNVNRSKEIGRNFFC